MNKLTADLTPLEQAAELRREFPTTLLSWGNVLRLMVRLGLGKYDLEGWCAESPEGFKRKIGRRRRWLYSREFVLGRVLGGEERGGLTTDQTDGHRCS